MTKPKVLGCVFAPSRQTNWRKDEIARELQARFPLPGLVPEGSAFHGSSSAVELKENYGLPVIDRLVLDAQEFPSPGLINVAEINCDVKNDIKRINSGFAELDRQIGGFASGELSVWTGKRGEGRMILL